MVKITNKVAVRPFCDRSTCVCTCVFLHALAPLSTSHFRTQTSLLLVSRAGLNPQPSSPSLSCTHARTHARTHEHTQTPRDTQKHARTCSRTGGVVHNGREGEAGRCSNLRLHEVDEAFTVDLYKFWKSALLRHTALLYSTCQRE